MYAGLDPSGMTAVQSQAHAVIAKDNIAALYSAFAVGFCGIVAR